MSSGPAAPAATRRFAASSATIPSSIGRRASRNPQAIHTSADGEYWFENSRPECHADVMLGELMLFGRAGATGSALALRFGEGARRVRRGVQVTRFRIPQLYQSKIVN